MDVYISKLKLYTLNMYNFFVYQLYLKKTVRNVNPLRHYHALRKGPLVQCSEMLLPSSSSICPSSDSEMSGQAHTHLWYLYQLRKKKVYVERILLSSTRYTKMDKK